MTLFLLFNQILRETKIEPALEEALTIERFEFKIKILVLLILVSLSFILALRRIELKRFEKLFNKIAIRKNLVILLIAIFTFLGNLAMAKFFYWPIPKIHDEFSYLLTCDTFAHGRLTNPAHPLWEHFETFHITPFPTRASKFPPAQGLFMAIGQVLTGDPIVGIWLSMALACAATCWMLQAWVPPRWAMLGGILMVFNLGWFTYWTQSYWGGAVALFGGALVFGALRRIIKKPQVSHSLLFALGLAILVNSRPFEGFITGSFAIAMLFFWITKKTLSLKTIFQQIVLPSAIVLTLVVLIMGYYNYRVTGSCFKLPYQAYESVYNNLSNFIWVKPETRLITYNHKEFVDFYNVWYPNTFKKNFNPNFNFPFALEKLQDLFIFFLATPLNIFLLALSRAIKNSWVVFSLITIGVLLFAVLQVVVALTHYVAPGVCLLYYVLIQCMRYVYLWRWKKKPIGKFLVWSTPIYYCSMIFLLLFNSINPSLVLGFDPLRTDRYNKNDWSVVRNDLVRFLNNQEGEILILVTYSKNHIFHEEWVYNDADIDNAKVVWARSMSKEKDCNLVKYFKDRRIWRLKVLQGRDIELLPDVSLETVCPKD
ncbi:MAG: hypothetical protein HY819_20560 [Acidobacteria bacterium]|nr:hypothetical protein [Acidobacteriota bacterium]